MKLEQIYKEAYDKEYKYISDEVRDAMSDEPHLGLLPGEIEGWECEAHIAGLRAVAEAARHDSEL